MKFGGTSVADADAMTPRDRTSSARSWSRQPPATPPPVVVVSAMSKVTDGSSRPAGSPAERRRATTAAKQLRDLLERATAASRRRW